MSGSSSTPELVIGVVADDSALDAGMAGVRNRIKTDAAGMASDLKQVETAGAGVAAGLAEVGAAGAGMAGAMAEARRNTESVGSGMMSLRAAMAQAEAGTLSFEQAVADSGKSLGQLQRGAIALKDTLNPLDPITRKLEASQRALIAQYAAGYLTIGEYRQGLALTQAEYERQVAGMKQVTGSAGAMRAGFQQAGFQVSDFFVQVGGGTSVIRAASQQLPQLTQAMSLMGMGAGEAEGAFSKFAGFMAGPWGIAITVGASVLGVLAQALLKTDDATTKVTFSSYALGDAQSALGNIFDLTTGKIKTQSEALVALARAQALAGQVQAAEDQRQAQKALQGLSGPQWAFMGIGRPDNAIQYGDSGDRYTTPVGQVASQYLAGIGLTGRDAKALGLTADQLVAKLGKLQKAGQITDDQFKDAAKAITDFDLAAANQKVFADMEKAINGDTGALQQFLTPAKEHKAALSDSEKETRAALKAAKDYADKLAEQTATVGLSSDELKRREAVLLIQATREEALKAPTQALGIELLAEAERIKTNYQAWQAATDALERHKAIEDALTVTMPKVGELSDRISAALKEQNAEAKRLADDGIAAVNAGLYDLINNLQHLGGLGNVMGGLLGFAGGSATLGAIRGSTGDLLNTIVGTKEVKLDDGSSRIIGVRVGDELYKAFGPTGQFQATLIGALRSAGTGLTAGSLVAGKGYSTTEQAGGLLGGIGGSIAGSALSASATAAFGAAIGSAVPVIGTIIGGALGSLAGGLFGGGAKYGYAGSSGAGGNNSDATSAAAQLGDSLKSGLDSIAQALGLSVGNYSTSIGVTDGKYRISTTGRTGELKSGYSDVQVFGTGDAAAQAAEIAAMKDAIRDDALQGLSEADKQFLLKSSDFSAALTQVLNFHQIIDSVTASVTPFEASLNSLQKTFADQVAAYQSNGATTEQMTALQKYQQQQLDQLVQQSLSQYNSTFLTPDQQAAAARTQISATLTPLGYGGVSTVDQYTALVNATDPLKDPALYGALMNLADAFATLKDASDQAAQAADAQAAAQAAADAADAAAAAQLARQKAQLDIDLLNAEGQTATATALQRQMALDAMDESLRTEQQAVWRAQDIAAARDTLSQAYDRESAALQSTADTFRGFAADLQSFRDGLYTADAGTLSMSAALARLKSTGSLAALGNEASIQALPGAGQDYLAAAKANAASKADYERALAQVARITDGAIAGANGMASAADRQLAQMTKQVDGLIDLNDNTIGVQDAVDQLNALLVPPTVALSQQQADANALAADFQKSLLGATERASDQAVAAADAANGILTKLAKLMTKWDDDGLPVLNGSDPLHVTVDT